LLWKAVPTPDFAANVIQTVVGAPEGHNNYVAQTKILLPGKRRFSNRHNRPFNMSAGFRNLPLFVRFSRQLEFTEVGMQENCYVVEQFKSQWVVSVGGTRILTCQTKRMAIQVARRATMLLQQSQQAEMPCRDGRACSPGRSPMQRATVASRRDI
jgi:hypothetical protein